MKKLFLNQLCFIALFLVASMSCSDDSNENKPNITAPEGRMVAKIGTKSFEGTGGAQIANGEIVVGGISGSESISIFITKGDKTGNYEVKGVNIGTTPDAEINYSADGMSLYSSAFAPSGVKVGTVTIVQIDETNKTVSGTFSSKVVDDSGDAVELSSGSFNKLPYQTSGQSSLSAKIDGTAFAATVVSAYRGSGFIALNGQALNGGKIITLSVSEQIVPGTYSVGYIGEDVYGTYTVNLETFVSESGSVTITKHDKAAKRIEGTFSFSALPFFEEGSGHDITAGAFAVTYY